MCSVYPTPTVEAPPSFVARTARATPGWIGPIRPLAPNRLNKYDLINCQYFGINIIGKKHVFFEIMKDKPASARESKEQRYSHVAKFGAKRC